MLSAGSLRSKGLVKVSTIVICVTIVTANWNQPVKLILLNGLPRCVHRKLWFHFLVNQLIQWWLLMENSEKRRPIIILKNIFLIFEKTVGIHSYHNQLDLASSIHLDGVLILLLCIGVAPALPLVRTSSLQWSGSNSSTQIKDHTLIHHSLHT